MVVCADPRPQRVAWEWGSLRLEAGSGIGAYTCLIGSYRSALTIRPIGQLMVMQLDAGLSFAYSEFN